MTIISVGFDSEDAIACMPHLKGVVSVIALSSIDELLTSYLREAGCEIMSQLLHNEGWGIEGAKYQESQEKMYYA
jgi:hypothetical protein